MIVLSATGLSLSFGDTPVLRDVSFSVNEGDRLGIIGVNGAGKTTLLRLITGEAEPSEGSVFLSRDKSVGVLYQNTAEMALKGEETLLDHMISAFPELLAQEEEITARETELSRLSEAGDEAAAIRVGAALEEAHRRYAAGGGLEFRGRCRAMLLRMGFTESELSLPVSALSGGQNTRLALSRLLCREPDILMLDEPTNHLDIAALTWLEDFLVSYPKTVLLISHDRYFLDRVTTKTLHIEHTRARLYPGNYTKAKQLREEENASTEKRYKQQQKDIAKIEANIAFQRRCGQEHNFVTIRAKQKQLDRMEKVELAPPSPKDIRLSFRESELPSGNDVLTAKALSFSFGEKPLIEGMDFLIRRGERVLFLGQNGCGKSTLMKLLVGRLSPRSGRLDTGANVKIGYYDQENDTLDERNTVFSELRETYPHKTDFELRSALALFLFGAEEMVKPVSVLSGGERARLTLAKLVLTEINLLVLDEPTNHLDIGSREVLEEAILGFGGTVVAVSHDRYFINRVATRLVELDPAVPHGCRDYPLSEGEDGYACYRRMREEREAAATAEKKATPVSEGKLLYEQAKRENAERRSQERRRSAAEKKIPLLEVELEELQKELFGSAATNYVRAAEIEARRAEIEEELLSLYELTM
ncbi:MAG: ABC-F family ATP-binding cassette domain-containing protein [Clostridia bacterium]|nr:ABC-F family ATP-binding cassette domain-containing protein [Clostridia bacterium]